MTRHPVATREKQLEKALAWFHYFPIEHIVKSFTIKLSTRSKIPSDVAGSGQSVTIKALFHQAVIL